MHNRALLTAGLLSLSLALAACGGSSPAATHGGGNGGNGGGQATAAGEPTEATTETDDGSGNGNGKGNGTGTVDTSHGTAHVDVTGPATKSADLAFTPFLSHFGGTEQTVLYFTQTSGEGALAVTVTEGVLVAVLTGTDVTVSGVECTASNLQIDALSAKGSFDCPKNVVVLASGASAQNAGFKGTFEARG